MTEAAKPELTEEQSLLFKRPWIFIKGVPSMRFLPPEGPPEIAFAGRSNVGKSPLIHALESPRPKPRYYVTLPTYLSGLMRRIMPTRLLDWAVSKG